MSLRARRFVAVLSRAAVLFGFLFGVLPGGLIATVIGIAVPAIHRWPLPMTMLLLAALFGIPMGLLCAAVDRTLTRSTPEERLDPGGAVRHRVTLEVPVPPEQALEIVSQLAFEELEWTVTDRAAGHVEMVTPRSFRSLGEHITVDLHPTPGGSAVLIESRPLSFIVLIDYNKNCENALALRTRLRERSARIPREEEACPEPPSSKSPGD